MLKFKPLFEIDKIKLLVNFVKWFNEDRKFSSLGTSYNFNERLIIELLILKDLGHTCYLYNKLGLDIAIFCIRNHFLLGDSMMLC